MLSTFFSALLMLSFSLVGCGKDDDGNSLVNEQLPQEEEVADFSTRLSDTLLIAGRRCEGDETTEYDGTVHTCARDQWLITIDNVNVCTAGACTEVEVIPIVAELDRTDIISPNFSFFEIDALSPVNTSQQTALDDVWVRFDLGEETAEVVRR